MAAEKKVCGQTRLKLLRTVSSTNNSVLVAEVISPRANSVCLSAWYQRVAMKILTTPPKTNSCCPHFAIPYPPRAPGACRSQTHAA